MMVQLAVMDPYAEYFLIFAYVLIDHMVVKTHYNYSNKKKSKYSFIHNYVKK